MAEIQPLFETDTSIRLWRSWSESGVGWTVIHAVWVLLALGILGAIGYGVFGAIAYTRGRTWWVVFGLLPWWILFGAPSLGIVRMFIRGGEDSYVKINRYGVMALAASEDGPVRCIDDVRLEEREDRVVVQSSNAAPIPIPRQGLDPTHLERLRTAAGRYEEERVNRARVP